MFGGHLGELEAYVPPVEYSGVQFAGGAQTNKPHWIKDDYDAALAQARAEGKPLFVNFTGYSCTNCKWMKANMFPRPAIAERLDDFVLLELYTDTLDEALAEKNQTFQQEKFRTVAIPFYAILDAQENTIARFEGQTKDEAEFRRFLDMGAAKSVSAGLGR
jgi:thiol:disulfide interchange protein DsbD